MFGLDGSELAVIAIVALVVIGPKDLPRVMRMVGQWVAKARGMTRHVRAGFDTMMREAELEEMQKQWDAQNAAIIASTRVDAPMVIPDLPPPVPPGNDAKVEMLPIAKHGSDALIPDLPAPAAETPAEPRAA